jgi:phage terminase large subunit GpA-like protein
MELCNDKMREDLLPAIERSRYRDLLPRSGSGSRGGTVESVRFRNGVTLKFMSGGGGDKKRSAFTARVLVITEVDGMDAPGKISREADKITQLEARTLAFGSQARIFMECTVSIEQGRTWQEYQSGTASRILLPCPHCHELVSPEREHLNGWQTAESKVQAKLNSYFQCSECGKPWSEQERAVANSQGILIHKGQEIGDDGASILGELPRTDTLGFRWSAVNNLFLTSGDIGAKEWSASHAIDSDNAEKEMRQFIWCLPHVPSKHQTIPLDAMAIATRQKPIGRGVLPTGTEYLSVGTDLGKFLSYWIATAWLQDGSPHVVDYGRFEIASDHLGVERAIAVALREFRDFCLAGFGEEKRVPNQIWLDSNYQSNVVYRFIRETAKPHGNRFRPTRGLGAGQLRQQHYNRPKTTGASVLHIGEGFHFSFLPTSRVCLVELDSNHWKSVVHERLAMPVTEAGALTLFQTFPREHIALAKHLTAETQISEFVAGRGEVVRWEALRRDNHWLDSLSIACAAGHYCGARLVKPIIRAFNPHSSQRPPRKKRPNFALEGGREWRNE